MAEQETLEMDEILERITLYSLDKAQEKIEAGEEFTPFTIIVDGDHMFEESFPGDDEDAWRTAAESNVKASSAFSSHYAFCYDGFLMTDQGELDAIVVECATRDMEKAFVIARIYRKQGDTFVFEKMPAYIDDAESFYDELAVQRAKEHEELHAAEDAEMDEIQARIARLMNGETEE